MQPNAYSSVILSGATAIGSAGARDLSDFDRIVTYVEGVGTISTGVLTIEEAPSVGYTGTWAAIDTVDLTTLTGGAVTAAVHLTVGAYRAIRWRISTGVTGTDGAITVTVGAH